jgi:2-polyprenyl-3-methyl-5-hydroxy-6-metoxy-1,4-benzoquinol methylase
MKSKRGLYDRLVRKAVRTVYRTYYRYLFGRNLPFGAAMGRKIAQWERHHGLGDTPVSKDVWERQYQTGKWSYLQQLDELPRYSIITGYLQFLKPNPAILDVGCGEGLLFRRYRPYGYARYVGVDLSAAAQQLLAAEQDERTMFVCADANSYEPRERFDAIIFNESLYYLDSPLAVIDRCMNSLNDQGMIIVSTFEGSYRACAILKELQERYTLFDETRIGHSSKGWICSVFMNGPATADERARRIRSAAGPRLKGMSRPLSPI